MSDEERRRFSPDSSTQVWDKQRHGYKKKKKHKHKSKKRKREHYEEKKSDHNDQLSGSSNHTTASSDEDEVPEPKQKNEREFLIDIKPLSEYIDDRKELNNELFKILCRKDMKKLMPKTVKKLDVDELKCRCLDQLEIMSRKRLLRIMEGQEMNSSSSESEHDVRNAENAVSALEVAEENPVMESNQPSAQEDESVNIMEELSVGPDQDEIDALIDEQAKIAESPSVIGVESSPEKAMDSPKSEADTESQLLELEYRARALKSFMQARQSFDT